MRFGLANSFTAFLFWTAHCHGQVNVSIEDTDPRIVYIPSDQWRGSSEACPVCLDPNATLNVTWHDGTRSLNRTSEYYLARWSNSTSGSKGRTYVEDAPMRLSFEFSGSAVYVYAIIPHSTPLTDSKPAITNLTFTLDDTVAGHYLHSPSTNPHSTTFSFLTDMNVFSYDNLSHPDQHTLQVDIGPNSVLLLDRIILTEISDDQPSSDERKKKVATFAGAVAGSFGVFLLLAIALGTNLILRRNRARRRELEERANQSGNPAEFVPRYFPGTLPPPYSETSQPVMSDNPSLFPATLASSSSSFRSRNGVDSGVEGPDDEEPQIPRAPPPSFQEAISPAPNLEFAVTREVNHGGSPDAATGAREGHQPNR